MWRGDASKLVPSAPDASWSPVLAGVERLATRPEYGISHTPQALELSSRGSSVSHPHTAPRGGSLSTAMERVIRLERKRAGKVRHS